MSSTTIVRNRIKIRTVVSFAAIYLVAFGFIYSFFEETFYYTDPLVATGWVIGGAAVICLITLGLMRSAIDAAAGDKHGFRRFLPLSRYGRDFGNFEHVFFHDRSVIDAVLKRIDRSLMSNFGGPMLAGTEIVDQDRGLLERETRTFYESEIATTPRGTAVTLVMRSQDNTPLQALRWWIMLGGYIDRNRQFGFVLSSPLTIWFWIIPYIRGNFDIAERVKSTYSSAYNDMDILTLARGLHQAVFDAFVTVLEENDIDTSELKMQRAQVMNISISGGKVNMGNVVQGAMNKVAAKVGGGAK